MRNLIHGVCRKMYTVAPVDISCGGMILSLCFKNGGDILIYRLAGPFHVYMIPKQKKLSFLSRRTLLASQRVLVICLVWSVFLEWNYLQRRIANTNSDTKSGKITYDM